MSIGLYLHIPFCRGKCSYCDFISFPGLEDLAVDYARGLLMEYRLYQPRLAGETIASIYLGGGTPSLLPPDSIAELLRVLVSQASGDRIEVTLEANPDTLDGAKLAAFVEGGGSRLSLGVQTHEERLLRLLGRRHGVAEVEQAVLLARRMGISQISLDLIYGLPGQTIADWAGTLSFALALAPDHISAYGLELHPGTPLAGEVAAGTLVLPPEEEVAVMLETAMSRLPAAGFRHYEIANFAKPGAECRHNLNYWRHGRYLGLGAAAHSCLAGRRWANIADPCHYLGLLERGKMPIGVEEEIGPGEELIETVMLGLRLIEEGIVLARLEEKLGLAVSSLFGEALGRLIGEHLVCADDGRLRLTSSGVLLADYVVRALICALPDYLWST